MPVAKDQTASNDYWNSKSLVEEMEVGETWSQDVDNPKRVQKYVYEIGLKMRPRREFSTKKISPTELQVTRIA
jgi:hypothetical protein